MKDEAASIRCQILSPTIYVFLIPSRLSREDKKDFNYTYKIIRYKFAKPVFLIGACHATLSRAFSSRTFSSIVYKVCNIYMYIATVALRVSIIYSFGW